MNAQRVADHILSNRLTIMTSITILVLLGGLIMVPTPVANAQPGYSTYCSIDRNVRIDHPITWDVNEDYANPAQFSFTSGDNVTFLAQVIPHVGAFGDFGIPASQLADQRLSFYRNNASGFSLIDGDKYYIQSRSLSYLNPAFYLKFIYNDPDIGPVNAFQVFVGGAGNNYIFTLITTPQVFDEALPVAEEMIRSARLSSRPLTAC